MLNAIITLILRPNFDYGNVAKNNRSAIADNIIFPESATTYRTNNVL